MVARPGAMPQHHVPAPKETPPVVDRLRLALIHMVRRTMIEAVDKVWVTFEDELAQLTLSSVEPSVDAFEQFSNCCSRLARFIDSNMETTPGFLTQMDRLILACHSGATGPALHSVMTNELLIRRGDNQKTREQRVGVSVDTDTASIIDELRAISPPSDTTEREDKSSDSEIKMAGTVGTPSRQWTTRKRLSTRTSRQHQTKRVKRSLIAQWEDDEDLLRQEEVKRAGEDVPRKENEKKEKKQLSSRSLVKQVKASKCNPRQRTRGRQPRNSFGAEQKKPQVRRSERTAKRGEPRKAETGRKLRWNLRSASNESSASKGVSEGYQTRSKAKQEMKSAELEEAVNVTKKNCLIPEEEPREEDTAKNGEQGDTRVESAQQSGKVEIGAANDAEIKVGRFDIAALEREIDVALANSGVYPVGDEEDVESNSIENTQKLCADPKTKTVTVDERDDVENISSVVNGGSSDPSAERPMKELSPPGVIGHDVQVILDDNGVDCAVSGNDNDQGALQLPKAGTAPCLANDAQDLGISAEYQQPEAPFFESEMLEADFVESEEESAVPGLCDAGMRTASQVSHFKGCLRKSIRLVDAMLCKPPPGKTCTRGCDKIRARQCSEGVPCRDQLCRNWHDAEAHTELCKNDLCEFKNRIVLRETMNQIANLNEETKSLMTQWEEHLVEYTVATVDGTNKHTSMQLQQLHDDIERLFQRISSSKKEIESLESKQRLLLAYLSAIGITSQADAADNFPDFKTHYQ